MDFNFTSQICSSRDQSERLLALGLKAETADCCLVDDTMGSYDFQPYCVTKMKHILHNMRLCRNVLPAWSLHRLLCLLPTEYICDIDFQRIMQDFIFRSQDMYEEAIGCIETLIEDGYFYEEYLEK